MSLVGNTEYWTILRILTAIEFENATYNAHHIRFFEAIQSACPFGNVTVFTLAPKEHGMKESGAQ